MQKQIGGKETRNTEPNNGRMKENSGKILNLAVFFFEECAINQQK